LLSGNIGQCVYNLDMALNLYRRHRRDCEAGLSEDSRSGEFEERKKNWKRCTCRIFASGTLARRFKRRDTGRSTWEEARAVVAHWERAGSWEKEIPAPQPPPAVEPNSKRITIEHATKAFLAELRETAAFATHKKYRLLLKRFEELSDTLGYVMIDQWEPADVRQFRSAWGVSPATAVRRMAMLKPFFEYCLTNESITRNPAQAVKNPKGREVSRTEQKLPFTDAEIQRMYEACRRYGLTPRHRWNGEDVADFISLSIYTGLRISDVALFHVDRMKSTGEIRLRTTKAGTHVYTWIPRWLQDRIYTRAKKHGKSIFGEHRTKTIDVITDLWRRKLNKAWALCGIWEHAPTPHRFRHTFARILLQKPGVTVRDVATLLGNTEDVVRAHYAAWVPEHQERLTKILQEAFDDKPRPRIVAIHGGR
jgi:integrase